MKNIKLKKITLLSLFLLIILNCKGQKQDNSNINNKKIINSEKIKDIIIDTKKGININSIIDWELVDVTRFFGKKVENSDIDKFNQLEVEFNKDTLILNNEKALFIKKQLASNKYFGKGSLYEFNTEYLLNNYKIDVRKVVPYIEINYENSTNKETFNPYFLMNDAIYTGDYLFLYSNEYLLTFKKENINNNFKNDYLNECYSKASITKLPIIKNTLNEYNWQELNCSVKKVYTNNYIRLPDINNFKVFIFRNIDSDFSIYTLVILRGNKVITNKEIGFPDDVIDIDNDFILTEFEIDTNYNFILTTSSNKNKKTKLIKEEQFKISSEGKFLKIK